jgi:hypothetical protein
MALAAALSERKTQMKKNEAPKLKLNRETLKNLEKEALDGVAGGTWVTYYCKSAYSCYSPC